MNQYKFMKSLKLWIRRYKSSRVQLIRAFVFIMIFGCGIYILMAPNESLHDTDDHYYEEIFIGENETNPVKKFYPNSFHASGRSNHLLDLKNFQFTVNVPTDSQCISRNNRLLVIMVSSKQGNIEYRNLIRSTWGSLLRIRKWYIKLLFVISDELPPNMTKREMSSLRNEIARYKDIIKGNLSNPSLSPQKRSFYNEMMMYKWALTFCPNAEYILKTLDATFVDTFQVIEMVNYARNPRRVLICAINQNNEKLRLGPVLPNFCAPHALILSMDVVEKLYMDANDLFESAKVGEEGRALIQNLSVNPIGNIKSEKKYSELRNGTVEGRTGNTSLIAESTKAFEIHPNNIAHKVLHTPEVAFSWGLSGQVGKDQKLPWMFIPLPKLSLRVTMWIKTMWTKMVYVNSQVFEFRLSMEARIDPSLVSKIWKNFKTAPNKLDP